MNSPFSLACLCCLGSLAHGASSLVIDFESQSANDLFTGDVTGWTQDNPNLSAFGQTFPLAFISTSDYGSGSSNVGVLGTQFANTADNSATTVSGDIDSSGLQDLPANVTLNLAILDDNTDQFTGRDDFSVSLVGSASQSLATIQFTQDSGSSSFWNIAVGVNGAAPTAVSGAFVTAQSGYIFSMNFGPSSTDFRYGPSGGGSSPVLISSEAAVAGFGTGLAGIEMTHTPVATAGTSLNTLVFDNITVSVPEPSSLTLFGIAVSVLAARRRRS